VLGNHETMIFTEDLRYVSGKEQLVARLHGVSTPTCSIFGIPCWDAGWSAVRV